MSNAPPVDGEASTSRNSGAITAPVLFGLNDFYICDAEPGEIRGSPHTILEQVDETAQRIRCYFTGLDFDRSKAACGNAAILLFDKIGGWPKNELLIGELFAVLFRGVGGIQGALRRYRVRLCTWIVESRIFDLVRSVRIRYYYYFHTRCRGAFPNYAIWRDPPPSKRSAI